MSSLALPAPSGSIAPAKDGPQRLAISNAQILTQPTARQVPRSTAIKLLSPVEAGSGESSPDGQLPLSTWQSSGLELNELPRSPEGAVALMIPDLIAPVLPDAPSPRPGSSLESALPAANQQTPMRLGGLQTPLPRALALEAPANAGASSLELTEGGVNGKRAGLAPTVWPDSPEGILLISPGKSRPGALATVATSISCQTLPVALDSMAELTVGFSPADEHLPLAEKNAAPSTNLRKLTGRLDMPEEKEILNAPHQLVSVGESRLGISVAKVATIMTFNPPNRAKAIFTEESTPVIFGSVEPSSVNDLPGPALIPLPALRAAMASVVTAIEAIERAVSIEPKALNLQFAIGTERLDLRVELRNGSVHTTFRTNSTELRSALALEWQAVIPSGVGREVAMAPPVFIDSLSSGGQAGFGSLHQGSSHHRDHPASAPTPNAPSRDPADSRLMESAARPSPEPQPQSLLNAFA
ncbi:MAG: hypothetical protein WCR49_14445 [Opitutae bacterium]